MAWNTTWKILHTRQYIVEGDLVSTADGLDSIRQETISIPQLQTQLFTNLYAYCDTVYHFKEMITDSYATTYLETSWLIELSRQYCCFIIIRLSSNDRKRNKIEKSVTKNNFSVWDFEFDRALGGSKIPQERDTVLFCDCTVCVGYHRIFNGMRIVYSEYTILCVQYSPVLYCSW